MSVVTIIQIILLTAILVGLFGIGWLFKRTVDSSIKKLADEVAKRVSDHLDQKNRKSDGS